MHYGTFVKRRAFRIVRKHYQVRYFASSGYRLPMTDPLGPHAKKAFAFRYTTVNRRKLQEFYDSYYDWD